MQEIEILTETPDNPVPADAHVVRVVTADNLSLRAAHWAPTSPRVRGTVCLLQGRAEFIEKYFEVIEELRGRGFAVVTFDWRGQGRSARQVGNPRKGHVRSFRDYQRDLEAVHQQIIEPLMPKPVFCLAHSMGGAVALMAAREGRLPFRRLVTVAPMINLCMIRRPDWVARLALAMNAFGFGKSFVPGGGETSISTKPFAGNRLTGDARRYARNAAAAAALGAGAIGDPTVGWLHAAFRLMTRLSDPRLPLGIRLPALIVAAGADPICATPATERFAARLKAGHAIVIPGARHEILMERDEIREQFWAAFDAFIPGSPDAFGEPADTHGTATPVSSRERNAESDPEERSPSAGPARDRSEPAEEVQSEPAEPAREAVPAGLEASALEKSEDRLVEPAVADRDDRATIGG